MKLHIGTEALLLNATTPSPIYSTLNMPGSRLSNDVFSMVLVRGNQLILSLSNSSLNSGLISLSNQSIKIKNPYHILKFFSINVLFRSLWLIKNEEY